jgi:hypothetical protein
MDGYLGLVADMDTGLIRGALYRNVPTPSGSVRYLLSCTTEGCTTATEAASIVNAAFKDYAPVSAEAAGEIDSAFSVDIPFDAEVTLLTPNDEGNEKPFVEVRLAGRVTPIRLTAAQVGLLIATKRLVMEISSGWGSNLHYTYEHFVRRAARRRSVKAP